MDIQDKIVLGMNELEKVWVSFIEEKMVESHHRWFDHMRRPSEELISWG